MAELGGEPARRLAKCLHLTPVIFAALTTADGLRAWLAPRLEGDVGLGREATFHFDDGETFRWKTTEAASDATVRWDGHEAFAFPLDLRKTCTA